MSTQRYIKKIRWVFYMIFAPLFTVACSVLIHLIFGSLVSLTASGFLAASIATSIAAMTSLAPKSTDSGINQYILISDGVLPVMLMYAVSLLVLYIIMLFSEVLVLPANKYVRITLQVVGSICAFLNIGYCIKKTYRYEVNSGDLESTSNDEGMTNDKGE